MMPYLTSEFGNPGSLYELGRHAAAAVDEAREKTAMMFGCPKENVRFTSGGSEGNNLIIKGLLPTLGGAGRKHIITSQIEHESVIKAVDSCAKTGFCVTAVKPNDRGCITADEVRDALHPDTGLVSIMYVNNETGVRNEIEKIGMLCAERGIIFHSDCVQAAGNFKIDVDQFGLDFATISAHKFHGPKGVGAIYARVPTLLVPQISGGKMQEFGLRGGTENVPGIVGMGKACELAVGYLPAAAEENKKKLSHFIYELCGSGAHFNTPMEDMIAGTKTVSIQFDGIDNETLLLYLASRGIYVSAGSACMSHEVKPSHVLTAIGLTQEQARSTIRVSISRMTSYDELTAAGRAIKSYVQTVREVGL